MLWIIALTWVSCQDSSSLEVPQLHSAEVVAGTGNVDPAIVNKVRKLVAVELPQLQEVFDGKQIQRFFVYVHASRESMPEHLVAGVHEDAPGFAILGRHQIHLIWSQIIRSGALPKGVVRHELVHELLDQYVGSNGRHIPRWFHEGMAQMLAGDTYLNAREDDLMWRVAAGSLPRLATLEDRFPTITTQLRTAYAFSYSYVAWLMREFGMATLLQVVRYTDDVTSFGQALVGQTGRDALQLEEGWQHYILHGSGAPWRVLLDSWFSLLMIFILPVLVLALMRRLNSEQRAARQLAARAKTDKRMVAVAVERRAEYERAAAEFEAMQKAFEAQQGRRSEDVPSADFEERDAPDQLRRDGEPS